MPGKEQLGLEATYRLYQAAAGTWVFLAARFDTEFAALCNAIGRGDLIGDPRYRDWAGRRAHSGDLAAELGCVFAARPADEWESFLIARDIACVQADRSSHVRFLYEDPQPAAIGLMTQTKSRSFLDQAPGGEYWRHAPVVKFSDTPCVAGLPYEGLGEHTARVLRELGYDDAEIERLAGERVVKCAAADAPVPA